MICRDDPLFTFDEGCTATSTFNDSGLRDRT